MKAIVQVRADGTQRGTVHVCHPDHVFPLCRAQNRNSTGNWQVDFAMAPRCKRCLALYKELPEQLPALRGT